MSSDANVSFTVPSDDQGASRAIQALDDIIKPGGTVIVPCECKSTQIG